MDGHQRSLLQWVLSCPSGPVGRQHSEGCCAAVCKTAQTTAGRCGEFRVGTGEGRFWPSSFGSWADAVYPVMAWRHPKVRSRIYQQSTVSVDRTIRVM